MPASMLGPPALGDVLEEGLLLGEAEGDDVAVDGDRPAGDDQRLGRRVRAELGDDRRPAPRGARSRAAAGRRGGRRGGRGGGCGRRPASRVPAARARRPGSAASALGAGGFGAAGAAAARGRRRRGGVLGGCDRPARRAAGGVAARRLRRPAAGRRRGRGGRRDGRRASRPGRDRAGDSRAPVGIANSASSSWKRRPPTPRRSGSIAASRRRGRGERGRIVAGVTPVAEAGDELGADRLDDLVEERAGCRGRAPRARRGARCPAAASPPTSAVDEARRPPRRRPGRAGRGRWPRRSGRAPADSSWSSIDSASRIPPAASRAMRWIAAGSASDRRPRGSGASLPSISGDRQAPDVEPLEARQDRRREARRLGRGEHEDHEVGRLLERLEERVPGVLRDLVRLVEDVDLAPEVGRAGSGAARAGRGRRRCRGCEAASISIEVERRALADRRRTTGSASHGSPSWRFVQLTRLGEDPGERRLAGAARPDEQDRVRDPVRSGRRCGASRRPPPGRRSRRTSGRASVGRGPGAGRSRSRPPPVEGERSRNCRAPSVDLNVLVPTTTSGSDQAVPRHPTMIA